MYNSINRVICTSEKMGTHVSVFSLFYCECTSEKDGHSRVGLSAF